MSPRAQTRADRPLGPTFRALLAASAVSNLGDGIRLATLPLLATTLTNSPLLIAGVTVAQFLPWLLFGPIGGVIVDRSDRRRLILTTQLWRAIVMVVLAAVVIADAASIQLIFLVAFVITAGEILVDPSVVAVVPTIVARDDLDRANGRISGVEIVTNDLVGAPVGVGLFAVASWLPFAVDGASYLGSTLLFRRLPGRSQPRPRTGEAGADEPATTGTGTGGLRNGGFGRALRQVGADLPAGLRWLFRHPMLRPWTISVAVFNIGAATSFSLLVLLVIDVHNGSEAAFGITLTVAAVAGAIGSTVAPRLVERHGRAPVLLVAAGLSAVVLLGLAAAPSLSTVIALWAVGAGVSGILLAIGRGFIQRYCPNEILGRTAIASRTITRTAFVVGAFLGGVVGSTAGVRTAYAVAGAIQVMALLPMALALRNDHA